ncbi:MULTISPECIES: PRC-barrel domain-containing protein [unclassified Streptomyces]|uniref:PRC-barrel domain-containing protein n=1 Tax=unclassified Streptomyces TaxID=2593676 RepID=UPI002E2C5534|nr:PRC-barrel domain-containing protein [Streptomyces sp. NBC_00690]
MTNIWGYHAASGHQTGSDLTGFKVEATDGQIGKVDKYSEEVGAAFLVVDTGMWIFGKHVLLPAGTISRIDPAEQKVYVDRTKDEIKGSPEFDKDKHVGDTGYHHQVGTYYGTPRA